MNRRSLGAVVLFALLASGCAITLTPASFGAKAPTVSGAWRGPIAVSSIAQENPHPRFNANGTAFPVDLNLFSENLAELLSDSLQSAGVEIGSGGKSLRVEVVLLDFMFQGPCFVDYNVHLGDGKIFGQQTTGESVLFNRACRMAFESAVSQILQDARIIGYLGEY